MHRASNNVKRPLFPIVWLNFDGVELPRPAISIKLCSLGLLSPINGFGYVEQTVDKCFIGSEN